MEPTVPSEVGDLGMLAPPVDASDPAPVFDGISVVVPCYRSPGTLPELCRQVVEHVGPLCRDLEIVLVDDGSGDGTWDAIAELAYEHRWVHGVQLLRNYGQHNALLAGFRASRLPVILTIDDDLQNPPVEVPKLAAALTDDIDLVYGTPAEETQTRFRNLASVGTKRMMTSSLGPDVYPKLSAFRMFRRELLQAASAVQDPFVSVDVLLSWSTVQVTHVEVDFAARQDGQSGYTLRKLIRHAFNMITGYSTRPLRVVTMFGVGVAILGFAMLAFVLGRWAFGGAGVAGFTFLAAAVTLFSGVQLLSLGVLGEYLGRMHFRSMGRPSYSVRRSTPLRGPSGRSRIEGAPDQGAESWSPSAQDPMAPMSSR